MAAYFIPYASLKLKDESTWINFTSLIYHLALVMIPHVYTSGEQRIGNRILGILAKFVWKLQKIRLQQGKMFGMFRLK